MQFWHCSQWDSINSLLYWLVQQLLHTRCCSILCLKHTGMDKTMNINQSWPLPVLCYIAVQRGKVYVWQVHWCEHIAFSLSRASGKTLRTKAYTAYHILSEANGSLLATWEATLRRKTPLDRDYSIKVCQHCCLLRVNCSWQLFFLIEVE